MMRLMAPKTPRYIWQQPCWPALEFDAQVVSAALGEARLAQGMVEGKAHAIGLDPSGELAQGVFADEVMATAAIEGEVLDRAAVRSSVMRRLGLGRAGPRVRAVDGLVEVINDATQAHDAPLDHDRLWRWHSALFPGGTSGIRRIAVGQYRQHEDAMQIVSGPPGREVVHYVAPASRHVPAQMEKFLAWFSQTTPTPGQMQRPGPVLDGLARAAIAHLWFEAIHPFEDGNGRIGRAIADMAMAQDRRSPLRLYSLSRQLLASRSAYYDALNQAQRGACDVTAWVDWFARQFAAACAHAGGAIDLAIAKSQFWARHAGLPLNDRQRKMLQRLLDAGDGGFEGGLTAEKYMKMTGASKATATRDLAALLAAGSLWTAGQGKALKYYLAIPGWRHGVSGR